jgi:hypothetical protein
MPSKWLTAFRNAKTHFALNPRANSANSANSTADAQKDEDIRQSRPAEPCSEGSVPIAANSAISHRAAEQNIAIGTNGRYWHSRVGPGPTDTNPAESLGFQPAKSANGTNGTNGTGVSAENDLAEAGAGSAGTTAVHFLHIPVSILPVSLKAAFEERAAIAEVAGGLDREAAERLAWDEVNAGPIGDTPQAWRAWMNYRIQAWMARRLSRSEAMHSVWAEAECIWHCRNGAAPNPDRCAGCGEWMLDGPGIRLPDGAVVHFGNPDRFNCLLLYGQEWRGAASAALLALELKRPAGRS